MTVGKTLFANQGGDAFGHKRLEEYCNEIAATGTGAPAL